MAQGRETGEASPHRNRHQSTLGSARCRSQFCAAWSLGEVENGGEKERGSRELNRRRRAGCYGRDRRDFVAEESRSVGVLPLISDQA
jgi:hypothetical protein